MTFPIPFTAQPETRGPDYPCEAFRWSFQVYRWGLGFFHQHKFKDDPEWGTSHTDVWSIGLWWGWKWGADHFWYDGPHCMFSLGFVSVQWSNPACEECGK